MPKVIVIRLVPEAPVNGADFAARLNGLVITAFDVSFGKLGGVKLGEAQRIAPTGVSPLPPPVPIEDPNNRIFQHWDVVVDLVAGVRVEQRSVATAVIGIPGGLPEYETRDIRLDIQRAGQEIIDRNIYYNVSQAVLNDLADHGAYPGLGASVFLSLPPPGQGLNPNAANVPLPADGSPPNFTVLHAAVVKVLNADPGAGKYDLAELKPEQCQHVAREIAWNRQRDPLPVPARPLENMYTADLISNQPERERIRIEADRRTFEANLVRYIAVHNGDADRLSKYIFSLSAAIACAQRTDKQKRVGFRLPVRPTATAEAGKIAEIEVTLTS